MIQNQTLHPFRNKNKFTSLTFSNSDNGQSNSPQQNSESTLERKPLTDTFNNKSIPAKRRMSPFAIAGTLGAIALSGTALYTSHKGIKGVKNDIQKMTEKMTPASSQAPSNNSVIEKTLGNIETAINNLKNTNSASNVASANNAVVKEGLSIWGDTYLKLNKTGKVGKETIDLIQQDIAKSLNGDFQMKEVKNPKIWSVSYEGWGGFAGGQHDIANELPIAMKDAGLDSFAVAPLFKMDVIDKAGLSVAKDSFSLTPVKGAANKFLYKPTKELPGKVKEIELTKIYDEKMTGSDDKLQVFFAEVGPDKNKVIFVHDEKLFDFGKVEKNNIYQDIEKSNEKPRMAQFNNLTYELLAKAKEGKIKLPNGEALKAPGKLIAHEAWQSGGLLSKMRILSRAEEADNVRPKETTEYLREIASNTGIPIHNIGNGYQGWPKESGQMEEYYNVLYGKYANDLVENSCIVKDDVKKLNLFGTELQRVGFVGNWMNPAHAAVVLGTKLGTVSEGYSSEITQKGLASSLTKLIELKNAKGGIVAFPNGVDKKGFAASKENVDNVNKALSPSLTKILGKDADVAVRPYLQNWNDDASKVDIKKFVADKKHNKKLFLTLLKDSVESYKKATPDAKGDKFAESGLFGGNKLVGFHGGDKYVDLSDVDPSKDIPVFSMASRLDSQKGFDTMADAIAKTMKDWDPKKEKPIFLISGEGDKVLEKHLEEVKEKLGENGKRVLFTKGRMSEEGLLLTNMTTRNTMPSDFEPYGISDLKGLYAGSHVIVTDVGGMKSTGKISRKITDIDDKPETANAIALKDYDFMCILPNEEAKKSARDKNSTKLKDIILRDINLPEETAAKMDINALATNVSWDKGATQNYLDIMKIKVEDIKK